MFGSDEKKNIHSVRAHCGKVLKDYIKLVKDAKNCPFRWFNEKLSVEEKANFTETMQLPMNAMKAAIQRLEELDPSTWTVIDMHELGKRTVTEITETDKRYEQLSEARAIVIAHKRESGKEAIKQKHQQSMAEAKVAKIWMANGSSKQVFSILKTIGAHTAT